MMMVAGVVVAVAALVVPWLLRGTSLPEPDAETAVWFDKGVAKLREGSYAGARLALQEAVNKSPEFILGHLRLAEAEASLDNDTDAQQHLLHVVVPSNVRLPKEEQLRLDAVRASVLRQHDRAIAAYQELATLAPADPSRWLDVGRAEEAAGKRVAALKHYEQAVKLDAQYAAAHQRLGVLQSQGGQSQLALASFDEAIRLHRAGSNIEGEAEATLRKASVHIARRELSEAKAELESVTKVAENQKFVSLALRAKFEQARLAQAEGQFAESEKQWRTGVDQAIEARMYAIAVDGLRGLAFALITADRYADADVQLVKAIELAVEYKATRDEMRARSQRAAMRLQENKFAEAISMAEAPLKFFTAGHYVRNEAETKLVVSRAQEALEHYDEARKLASEVLTLGESVDDQVLIGTALENLAGQAQRLGQLPEALVLRERIEQTHRASNDHVSLAFDLVNRADLLIRLGRGGEGEAALAEVDKAIAEGRQMYAGRSRRVSLIRALRASIDERFTDVERYTRLVADPKAGTPSDTTVFAWVLAEYARARLGASRTDVAVIAGWPSKASEPSFRREMTYWVVRTLLLRRRPDLARTLSESAWAEAPARSNLELRWRLAALAAQAPGAPESMRASARADLQALLGQWTGAGVPYVARPDLAGLRKDLQ
jgi:tetratricopeptide (TPR) repeat protein